MAIWGFRYGVSDYSLKKPRLRRGVFTSKYNVTKLVYYEVFESIIEAIKREKQIKGGSRQKKIDLIKKINPNFRDLYNEIASA